MMFQMAHGADATSEAAGQMFNKMQYKPNYPICMHEGHYYNFASIRKLACTHKVAIQLISFLNFVSIKCYRSQLLADPQVGYTALMGVPPKVQPTFADINYTANKTLGYTALMGVPPKVQPTFADINYTANKTLGYTALMGVPPKVQPTFADINYTANKTLGYTALMGVPPKVQPAFVNIYNHTV